MGLSAAILRRLRGGQDAQHRHDGKERGRPAECRRRQLGVVLRRFRAGLNQRRRGNLHQHL